MTLHFPEQVETNILTLDTWDPEVGHGGVQGDRDPGGEGVARGGRRRPQETY